MSDSTPNPQGPPVGDHEDLYRCLTHPHWYNQVEDRVSSAAFNWPVFSVDIASISGSPEATLAPFLSGTGLVVFRCGEARLIGCDPRHESDELRPDNLAHAHVYMPLPNSQRKKAARRLADLCRTIRKPTFTPP